MHKPLILSLALSLAVAPALHAEGDGALFTIASRDQVAKAEAEDAASTTSSRQRQLAREKRRAAFEQAQQEAADARLQALEDERLASIAWRQEPYWTMHPEFTRHSSNCYLNPCYRWSGEWSKFIAGGGMAAPAPTGCVDLGNF